MPDEGTSSRTRLAAVVGLIVVSIAVIAVIAASIGGSSNGGNESEISPGTPGPDITASEPTRTSQDVKTALARGEYIVKSGDTLTTISEATGVDIETLQQLNPGIDPQALPEGARIRLK